MAIVDVKLGETCDWPREYVHDREGCDGGLGCVGDAEVLAAAVVTVELLPGRRGGRTQQLRCRTCAAPGCRHDFLHVASPWVMEACVGHLNIARARWCQRAAAA